MRNAFDLLWFVTFGACVELFEKRDLSEDPLLLLLELTTSMPGVVVRCIHVALAVGAGLGWLVHYFLS